ncbi:hypothetical protein CPHO_12315 [Corynebacterium phocae]|uniref:Uncharacterized protein n=1 Tax=Corynebacterium phocae TaxID=161895 RepID=A0A1L7D5V2_9CORY|nr:YqgE/AlgH family protein [Corynebacterium phocae]APT93546.1 hypothetical protein CPHO_12315 [Corynebacterium phocae]KAA8720632.1 YqgE/AlgH family protein [Corynebacterium phocae]
MTQKPLFVDLERNEPAAGQLLIAAPGKRDHPRSVFLIVEHSDQLTFGVDLTTRSEIAVFNVLPEWLPVVAKPQAFYIGGPLNQQNVMGFGMSATGIKPEDHPELNKIAPRLVYVDMRADPEKLKSLVSGLRLFAGFQEWGPGELAAEIEEGGWYVAPALPQDVIAPGGADLWADVMKRQPMPLPLYSTFPAEPEGN